MSQLYVLWSVAVLAAVLPYAAGQCMGCELYGDFSKCGGLLLGSVPQCLPEFITMLDLWNNNISNIAREDFRTIPNIENLDLGYNNIEYLPDNVFGLMPNLSVLTLLSNKIQTLQADIFTENVKLTSLNFELNDIVTISELVFQPLVNLEYLFLYYNRLQTFDNPNVLASNINLKKVDLAYNYLTTIDETVFANQRDMEVYLVDNPWNCDCKISNMLNAFAQWNITVQLSRTKCKTPPELSGIGWDQLGDLPC